MHWLFREYKGFSAREKRSLLIILLLIIALLILRILQSYIKPDSLIVSSEQKQEIDTFIQSFEKKADSSPVENSLSAGSGGSADNYNFKIFDPNRADKEELLRMGLNAFVVNNILAYRKAGGKFDKAQDLSRIYGLEEKVYEQLIPYINIKEPDFRESDSTATLEPHVNKTQEQETKAVQNIPVNKASFAELMKIPELSPRLAGRIINYRDLLGGYYSLDQMDEVYGMTDSMKIILQDFLVIDQDNILKISLRESDFATMLRHPYLEKLHVKKFFDLKDFYGDSISLKHIRNNRIFPDSILKRIEPYLQDSIIFN